jgi:hypothetical protein
MILTIVTHVLAFLGGGGAVLAYVHKGHSAAVKAASDAAAAAIATVKADVKKV